VPTALQIAGLLLTTFSPNPWSRYGGLLIVGFGLGPTVPITMTWTASIFQPRHGEVGVAAASALVSGLGNLGSIVTTYALYAGWPADSVPGPDQYRYSNLVMIGMLVVSIASSWINVLLLHFTTKKQKQTSSGSSTTEGETTIMDGAARRELREAGLGKFGRRK